MWVLLMDMSEFKKQRSLTRKGNQMPDTKIYECLKPVKSSMFSRAGYSESTWELIFEFLSTKEIRSYKNVAPEVADEALTTPSIGKWWNANVKSNPAWEYDVLGADPSQMPEPPKAKPVESLSVMDEDIKLVEPGWNGHGIDPAENDGIETHAPTEEHTWPVYGGIDRSQTTIPTPKQMHVSEIGNWPTGQEIEKELASFDEGEFKAAGNAPIFNSPGFFAQEAEQQTAIVRQPVGEVLAAWRAPESAAEALDLLSEREGEIKAIIAQNVETGQQALTVRIDTAEKRVEASETLNRLVSKADTTKAALDPLRKVLYEVYMETGGKVKAGLEPLEAGIKHVKAQILGWDQAQERIRQQKIREDNERRDAEARRLQEAEAARLKLLDVQDALDEGDEQRAETLFDAPVIEVPRPYVAPVYVPPAAPKIEGQSTSTKWKVDEDLIEDDQAYTASIVALMRAVIAGKYDMQQAAALLKWDLSAANKLAGALGASFNVPGLSVKEVGSLSVRRKKK
jgi:hypothetical protein